MTISTCFRIFLYAELSSPFISSTLESSAFQSYILSSSLPDIVKSRSATNDKLDNLHRQSEGRVRVTLASRGVDRRILNLEQVLAMLKQISFLDDIWLHDHIVDMSLLSFEQQVCFA